MRNPGLHDALRDFALEAAALLTADVESGQELPFDVEEARGRRQAILYNYRPLTAEYIAKRWHRLSVLQAFRPAAQALGAGAAGYLRLQGLGGGDPEPALRAMLERLYEDASGFDFPEERFERVYADVEGALYEGSTRGCVVAPLRGLRLDVERVELGPGLSLVAGDRADAPPEAVWDGEEPNALCVLEHDLDPGAPLPIHEARMRFAGLVTGLRLFKGGALALGPIGHARADGGAWQRFPIGTEILPAGDCFRLVAAEVDELRGFLETVGRSGCGGAVSWALARFEMGCERPLAIEALSDHLLALTALLDARDEAGRASLPLRVAALCAEETSRRSVQRRVEQAFALERYAMAGGAGEAYVDAIGAESPDRLTAQIADVTRAILRDVLCGYLEPDLRNVADGLLLASEEPFQIQARALPQFDLESEVAEAEKIIGVVYRGEDTRAAPDEGELGR